MSELVVRAEAQGALPPEEVAVALGAPGGLAWIEAPWELADDAAAAQGGELRWTLGGQSVTAAVLQADEQELHFRSADGRLEGRIQFRSRTDGGSGTAASFRGRFPVSGGGIGDRVAVAVMRGNMEKLAGEETTKGLKRLLDNGAPPRPEKKAAAPAPAPTPVDAALTVSPGATQLDPVAVWRTALRRLPAVDSAPAKPPTASRLYPLDPSGRPLPAERTRRRSRSIPRRTSVVSSAEAARPCSGSCASTAAPRPLATGASTWVWAAGTERCSSPTDGSSASPRAASAPRR